jgi:hypothetical protein
MTQASVSFSTAVCKIRLASLLHFILLILQRTGQAGQKIFDFAMHSTGVLHGPGPAPD